MTKIREERSEIMDNCHVRHLKFGLKLQYIGKYRTKDFGDSSLAFDTVIVLIHLIVLKDLF